MIELRDVVLQSGNFVSPSISFQIQSGQYAVLMGTTGRGKTTLLEGICGLRKVVKGGIFIHGQDVTRLSPTDRNLGYVPQDLALFPTLNVREHLEFALKLRGRPKAEIQERTKWMSELLGITHLLERSIAGLSGGEGQRVALGRALSFRPSVLLLDEPLSALDESTRSEMYSVLQMVKRTTGVTTLHVTHNIQEAELLADQHLLLTPEGIHSNQ